MENDMSNKKFVAIRITQTIQVEVSTEPTAQLQDSNWPQT